MNDIERRRLLNDGWDEHAIHCAERFGIGPTMLVPLVKREEKGVLIREGRVVTPLGPGVLLQAFEDATVLLDKDARKAERAAPLQAGVRPMPGLARWPKARQFHWREVVPEGGEAARRMREEN